MATSESLSGRFSWGDEVRIIETAPSRYKTIGAIGCICGVGSVRSNAAVEQFSEPMGTVLYLVEGSDGGALEIPEHFLSPLDE